MLGRLPKEGELAVRVALVAGAVLVVGTLLGEWSVVPAGLLGALWVVDRMDAREAETPIERVQRQYAEGRIDEAELERRVEVLADPEAERVRELAESVSGIGEKTSFGVAWRYRTRDELRAAEVDELEGIPNVGEERARALREL